MFAAAFVLAVAPVRARADWWSDNFEVHGFLRSRIYLRSRSLDFAREAKISSWRTVLDIEPTVHIYRGENLRIGFFGIFRPTYNAVYNVNPHLWGEDARGGSFGSAPFGFTFRTGPDNLGISGTSPLAVALAGNGPNRDVTSAVLNGEPFPGHGAGINGETYYLNSDTLSLFRQTPGALINPTTFTGGGGPIGVDFSTYDAAIAEVTRDAGVPATGINGTASFGAEVDPILPTGSRQPEIGGKPSAAPFLAYLHSNARIVLGFDQARQAVVRAGLGSGAAASSLAATIVNGSTAALAASLAMASKPLTTPFSPYGDASSFEQSPIDINRNQTRLAWDCRDNAHRECFMREAYFDITYKNLFLRIGKQQIVWGRADGFQLQDIVNPRDLGEHNIFPLTGDEDRRIPQFALDAQYDLGDIGPLDDVSFEFVWNFDKFLPNQFGQCGEPYAFTLSCSARGLAAVNQYLGIGLASSERIPWKFQNTEPGLRFHFRIPRPSISMSLSAYWGFQDNPVQKFMNLYSYKNPNIAPMLLLQGQVAGLLAAAAELQAPGDPDVLAGAAGILHGFDPYNPAQVALVNKAYRAGYEFIVKTQCVAHGDTQGAALGACLDRTGANLFALPWTGGQVELVYPRVLTLGGSADYEIPDSGTVVRGEFAYDFNEGIQDTSAYPTLMRKSDVFKFMIGLDRPTFIPFLNPSRTAFLSFQTFLSHIVQYGNHGYGTGTVLPETQLISTFFMQNYWRGGSLTLTNFVAYDWNARAWATGPQLTWVLNNHISFDFGVNVLFGDQNHVHNTIDLCKSAQLTVAGSCSALDPATWQAGQVQLQNRDTARFSQSAAEILQGFADRFMEDRDEVWAGVTYQF